MIERQHRRGGRLYEREISSEQASSSTGRPAEEHWLVCCFGQSCDNLSSSQSLHRRSDEYDREELQPEAG